VRSDAKDAIIFFPDAVFSHTLCALIVLAVSIMPGVVSSQSSHMPCVGSLFSRYLSRLA